ncbi:MAG: protein-disulfide reductase DsbD family protein [Gammaproteobacteria bacterium]|nr:protein-disulfide reductase DsbD family protein [Gammaproteobacteria bacterium]
MTDKIHVKRLFVLCIVLVGGSVASQLTNDHEFLPVDEAYPTEAQLSEDGRVLARWVMPDGYYLYKHALKIVGKEGTELGSLVIPTGKKKTDEFFGEVEVYYNFLEISVPVLGQSHANVVVDVHFQGCADAGLCYPPEVREFRFEEGGADIGGFSP